MFFPQQNLPKITTSSIGIDIDETRSQVMGNWIMHPAERFGNPENLNKVLMRTKSAQSKMFHMGNHKKW
jgi:hypothetical protein